MAGLLPAGTEREAVRPTYVTNLRWAAAQADKQGVQLLIEPINTRDIPGFFLNRQDHAHELIAEIGAANVQGADGPVPLPDRRGRRGHEDPPVPAHRAVGHFQIAGVPERHEPDVGEMNYPYLFEVIDEVSAQCGWTGWVGCEYRPARGAQPGGTSAGLDWFKPWRA